MVQVWVSMFSFVVCHDVSITPGYIPQKPTHEARTPVVVAKLLVGADVACNALNNNGCWQRLAVNS